MSGRAQLAFAVLVVLSIVSACAQPAPRKCTGFYQDVREYGYCDLGSNRSRDLTWTW